MDRSFVVLVGLLAMCALSWGDVNHASTGWFANRNFNCAPPVLNQGNCGSCYSFASATTFGTTLCRQLGNTVFTQLSPQFILNFNYAFSNSQNVPIDPCHGGLPMLIATNLAASGTQSFGTCTQNCSAGCLPYNATLNVRCCSNFNTGLGCQSSSGATASSIPTGFITGAADLTTSSASTLSDPNIIANVQSWLQNNGPVAVGVDAGAAFMAWHISHGLCPFPETQFARPQGFLPNAQYNCITFCISTNASVLTTSRFPWYATTIRQSTGATLPIYYTCAAARGTVPMPVSGVGCNGNPNHAVTIVGWTSLMTPGTNTWIIQNSWGTEVGDQGFFYVDFNNVGSDVNQIMLGTPIGLQTTATVATPATVPPTAAPTTTTASSWWWSSLGAEHSVDDSSIDAAECIDAYIGHANAQLGTTHQLVGVHNVTRQVVEGVLFKLHLRLGSDTNDSFHHDHSATLHSFGDGAWTVHRMQMQAVPISGPSAATSRAVAIGVGVGMACIALVVVGVLLVIKRRRTTVAVTA